MQPRRFWSPFREIVFHVTNNGYLSLGFGPREESEDCDVLGVRTSAFLLDAEEVDGRLLLELAALSFWCCVIAAGNAVVCSSVVALVV